jgi:hypothetical protein
VNFSDFEDFEYFEHLFHLVEDEFVAKSFLQECIDEMSPSMFEDKKAYLKKNKAFAEFVKSIPDNVQIRIRE